MYCKDIVKRGTGHCSRRPRTALAQAGRDKNAHKWRWREKPDHARSVLLAWPGHFSAQRRPERRDSPRDGEFRPRAARDCRSLPHFGGPFANQQSIRKRPFAGVAEELWSLRASCRHKRWGRGLGRYAQPKAHPTETGRPRGAGCHPRKEIDDFVYHALLRLAQVCTSGENCRVLWFM
jgi:hypothetical protein